MSIRPRPAVHEKPYAGKSTCGDHRPLITRPVLAIVVNLVIIIAGLQAIRTINVRQYPKSENAMVTVTTAYVGANAELVRGFITSPLERAIAAADGIEYMESQSAGHLDHQCQVAPQLRLDQSPRRDKLEGRPGAPRPPSRSRSPGHKHRVGRQPFRLGHLSFSSDILEQNEITDYLVRVVQPRLSPYPACRGPTCRACAPPPRANGSRPTRRPPT